MHSSFRFSNLSVPQKPTTQHLKRLARRHPIAAFTVWPLQFLVRLVQSPKAGQNANRMNAPTARSAEGGAAKAGLPEMSGSMDSTAVTKRLQQELTSMMCGGDSGVSAFPSGDSLFNWVGTITVSY